MAETQLQCSVCSRQFSRLEHLKRHALIHQGDKPFKCDQCSKLFSRKDALIRHEQSHASSSAQTSATLCRTCSACAKARIKCSGASPCDFCATRNLVCVFRPRQKRRRLDLSHDSTRSQETAFEQQSIEESTAIETVSPENSFPEYAHPNVLDVLDQEPVAMNWLPFVPLQLFGDVQSGNPSNDPGQVEILDEAISNTVGFPNDQYSALITSMGQSMAYAPSQCSSTEISQVGKHYADGMGSRSSRQERRMLEPSRTVTVDWSQSLAEKSKDVPYRMSEDVHAELLAKLSGFDSDLPHGSADALMRFESWSYFIHLYFSGFHKVYPFLDQSLLGLPKWGWILCLATASIGARDSEIPSMRTCAEWLSKVLYKILFQEVDLGKDDDSLPFIQARALCAVGLCQSQQGSLTNYGSIALNLMCNSCLRLRLLTEDSRIGIFQPGQDPEQAWIAWRFRETRRRTGLFIWIVDASMAFTRGVSPSFTTKQLTLLLPSSDELWEAETCQQWFECSASATDVTTFVKEEQTRISVQDIVRQLWTKLELSTSLTTSISEILIHMLIQRVWSAETHLSDSIDSFPNESSQSTTHLQYLGADPDFAKWRNTCCDCLDVLHWEAHSGSAKLSGHESPTFLLLHLSRLLLLTPLKDLFCYLHNYLEQMPRCVLPHSIFETIKPNRRSTEIVLTWFVQDRYKARLALVHAGATFWHVRRYGSSSYVQPFAVYLATVVLWAYSVCAAQHVVSESQGMTHDQDLDHAGEILQLPQTQTSPGAASAISRYSSQNAQVHRVNPRLPEQAQLDRPIDDELVQHHIRHGDFRICLEGVPDLCATEGPQQVLQEGIKILRDCNSMWSITDAYTYCLEEILVSQFKLNSTN